MYMITKRPNVKVLEGLVMTVDGDTVIVMLSPSESIDSQSMSG